MRAKARKSGLFLRVLKNTLARRAVKGTPFEKLSDQIQVMLVPSNGGPLILDLANLLPNPTPAP